MRGAVGFLHSHRAGVAAGLLITGVDSKTSCASDCRFRRSEVGFILELGCQTVLFVRIILRAAIDLRT
eukprot:4618923-Pyramimonas_sp.AAC.1